MRSECRVFSTSLLGDSVHVVLGVLGRRPCGSSGRQMAYVGVLGACAAFLSHARRYTLCKRRASSIDGVSPASRAGGIRTRDLLTPSQTR
jgi:hypothetical protein